MVGPKTIGYGQGDKFGRTPVSILILNTLKGLTRDYEPGQKKLLEGNGLDILIKSLQSPVEKLQIKSCFLCSSICNNASIKSSLNLSYMIFFIFPHKLII